MGVLPTGLGVFVCTMIWTKFILATSRRALYPFAPEVGRATGVSEQSVASVLAVMQGCYCLVPLLTPWLARRVGTDHILVGAVALVAPGHSWRVPFRSRTLLPLRWWWPALVLARASSTQLCSCGFACSCQRNSEAPVRRLLVPAVLTGPLRW